MLPVIDPEQIIRFMQGVGGAKLVHVWRGMGGTVGLAELV